MACGKAGLTASACTVGEGKEAMPELVDFSLT